MAAHLEHAARPFARFGMAEAGIEEARVMHPEFADHGQVGGHFRRAGGRDGDRLATHEDVEGAGVQDDAARGGPDLFPIVHRVVVAQPVEVDHAGMRLGAIPHKVARGRFQIDREAQPVRDHRIARDDGRLRMYGAKLIIRQERPAGAEDHLVEHLAAARHNRKRPWADFHVKLAGVALGHAVEFDAVVGDHPGQKVEPPDRGLGRRRPREPFGQGEAFHQRDHVDAALFQHGPVLQVHRVHLEIREPFGHGRAATGQKGRAHPVGGGPEAQIKRGGLDLVVGDGLRGGDGARIDQRLHLPVREHAGGKFHHVLALRTHETPAATGRRAFLQWSG